MIGADPRHGARCPACQHPCPAPGSDGTLLECPQCRVRFPHPEARSIPLDPGSTRGKPQFIDLTPRFRERYQLVRILGSGALGSVYEATDRQLSLPVAIKFLLRTDRELLLRFKREGEILSRMQHPHVVHVHEFDVHGIHPYLAMEFVAGGSLATRLANGGLPIDEALTIVREILWGLQAVHARQVIHRDLKPENVLLTEEGRVKLADFGIAKDTSGSGQIVTQIGVLLGSPKYMSPEQCRSAPVSAASDLYSVGLIAHELLTGSYPYTAKNMREMIQCHEHVIPPPLESRVVSLALPIARALDRTLAKHPQERPQSADELLKALDPVLPRKQAPHYAPRPDELVYERPAPAPRRDSSLILGALGLAAGIVLAVVLAWLLR